MLSNSQYSRYLLKLFVIFSNAINDAEPYSIAHRKLCKERNYIFRRLEKIAHSKEA